MEEIVVGRAGSGSVSTQLGVSDVADDGGARSGSA